jgi:ABC-type microcin C transport system permease subunit YejE
MRQVSPLNARRWRNFKANRRGLISLWLFGVLFFVTLFAEFLANDKPLLVLHDGGIYLPVFVAYPETDLAAISPPRPITATPMSPNSLRVRAARWSGRFCAIATTR